MAPKSAPNIIALPNGMLLLGSNPSTLSALRVTARTHESAGEHAGGKNVSTRAVNDGITVHLDRKICARCRIAVTAILTNSFPAEHWRTAQSEYDSVKYLDEQQYTNSQSGDRPVSTQCQVCALILEQLGHYKTARESAKSGYFVFVKPQDVIKRQLQICFDDVSRFTRPMKEWEKTQATMLRLFEKPMSKGERIFGKTHNAITITQSQRLGVALCRLPTQDLASDQAFRQAKLWKQDCLANHPECSSSRSVLPKRVLDLSSLHINGTVYLRRSYEIEPDVYATVSYTWGSKGFKRLKTENKKPYHTEQYHRAGINIARFPQTLQDAIQIAKQLDFRYLWVDSVCIIQDSMDDWAEQSVAMTQIYGGARLNISATSSENSEWGVLSSLPPHGTSIGCATLSQADQKQHQQNQANFREVSIGKPLDALDLEDKFLAKRGWVFQERLVSKATLHYTDEGLLWECVHGIKMGHDQDFHGVDWKKQWKAVMDAAPTQQSNQDGQTDDAPKRAALRSWNEWMAAYAERELYDYKDRLQAIAGVAKTLARKFDLTYAAGLWQEDLMAGLMWKRFNRTETLVKVKHDTTPSWSWASVQGRLEYLEVTFIESYKGEGLKIIGRAEVQEERPGPDGQPSYGRVLSGEIQVRGWLARVVVDKHVHPGSRQRPWEEVGVKSGFVNPINVLVMLDEPRVSDEPRVPDENLQSCWCLRIGSYADSGREGDLFLLLEQTGSDSNRYRRIGFVETDAWANSLSVTPDSGKLKSAKLCDLILV